MNRNKWIGVGILGIVAVVAAIYIFFVANQPKEVAINGLLGGEKIGLFQSQEFLDTMKKKNHLNVDYRKAGSIAMAVETAQNHNAENYDYLFPASKIAAEIYKEQGGTAVASDIIFNTPLVLYSRKPVVDALMKQKVVTQREGIYYVNMKSLAALIAKGTSWESIGLPQLYGNVLVDTTDPNASNSGNMFLGLLANSINDGKVVTEDTLPQVEETVRRIYQEIGHMQSSSSDMFNQFLKQGVGAYPIVAGYENQILELTRMEPDLFQQVKSDLVLLYPTPTVWADHVYVALTENGKKGMDALLTKEVQAMAWKNHGFRTIAAGTADTSLFPVKGVPKDITGVMPMPSYAVMQKLMQSIR